MSGQRVEVAFDARDPERLGQFWAGMLDRDPVREGGPVRLTGTDVQVGLRFVPSSSAGGPAELHLHLTSASPADQQRVVDQAVDLGASHLDVGQRPEESHIVLADPEGNPFCVIEPGNGFLAGCGLLGEVACDGSRDVGQFWSSALGWPMVWDHDQETAIQAPAGGTKIAWGGHPSPPRQMRRHRLCLVASGDQAREIARLISLGATRLGSLCLGSSGLESSRGEAVALADADGVEFWLV